MATTPPSSTIRSAICGSSVCAIARRHCEIRRSPCGRASITRRRTFEKLAERKNNDRAPLWLKLDARDVPDPELGYEPELYHFTAHAV